MCVHFRYGPHMVALEAFPGSRLSALPYSPWLSVPVTPSPYRCTDLPVHQVLRLVQLFRPLVAFTVSVTPSPICGYRNFRLSSIGYACRPRLRSRLTQSGRAFLWNPWAIGAWDSHPRAATHAGILSSIRSTPPFGSASPLMQCSPTIPQDP